MVFWYLFDLHPCGKAKYPPFTVNCSTPLRLHVEDTLAMLIILKPEYASINVKPKGGTPRICGAFDFSEEFLVKIPTVGPQNLIKLDQISPGVPSIYIENE